MKKILQGIKTIWPWIEKHASAIKAVCALTTLILFIVGGLFSCCLKYRQSEQTYIARRPNIKVKSVYFKQYPYQQPDGSQSVALRFFIPIKNEGDITAYDVEIRKKEISIPRGHYNLSDSSLKSQYTSSPFDLKQRQTIEDTIFIDESPSDMQKISNGEESISLTYEIYFYADKRKNREPFIYEYKSSFNKGELESLYENVQQVLRP